MLYLYTLLVVSLAALLWAVWAIRKHVRAHREEDLHGANSGDLDEPIGEVLSKAAAEPKGSLKNDLR